MALRQWMVTHEWMVKPTPQTEWIDRRGLWLWLAEVANTVGVGLYLVALCYQNLQGMVAGLLVIIFLKMLPHLIFLGKPWRFWRMIPPFTSAWRTSWITRGMVFTLLFMGFALIQIVLTRLAPGTGAEITFKVLAAAAALLTGVYSGFAMGCCRSIPFWDYGLLPVLFLIVGIADGFAYMMGIALADGQPNITGIENGGRLLLIASALVITVYLWRVFRGEATARHAVELLLRGRMAPAFWGGVAILGIAVPLAVSFTSPFAGGATAGLLIAAIISHTIGTFTLKYILLKAGFHPPLLPV